MSAQPSRNSEGGCIDRSRPLRFTFNGRSYSGYAGDTLAAALLANGVHLVGRSFKYHRPRGIFTAGVEEPNALVQLRTGWQSEPNTRATQVELFEGLSARSQNCWPSVAWDVGALNGVFSAFLPAGFYYKTFMWPPGAWMHYERFIRKAAGLGRASGAADEDRYDKQHAHCDVLVAGGGPAGLAAALAAGRAGADVFLADEGFAFGGALLGQRAEIGGAPAQDWIASTVAELADLPNVRLLSRATVFGYYDHNLLGIVERVGDHRSSGEAHAPRQRVWRVRARRVVLATGAIERPLVFGNNDRPGIMLASAARTYVNRYAVRPGTRAVVFTNNDTGWDAALDLAAGGVNVAAVVDVRSEEFRDASKARGQGIETIPGSVVTTARGRGRVRGVEVRRLDETARAVRGRPRHIECDLLCVAGGWNPSVHLHAQSRGRPEWEAQASMFVPGRSVQGERSAGAARGVGSVGACLRDALAAGAAAAAETGHGNGAAPPPPETSEPAPGPIRAMWIVPGRKRGKRFVDLQNDVTWDDVGSAVREGYRSVEHLKRYTTLGMGTDQGKTSNVNGLAAVATELDTDIPSVGYTTFRPPYTPVTLGALAGRESGTRLDPVRRTSMHAWHEGAGAVFTPSGLWLRPRYYPRSGETLFEASKREAAAVRSRVGMVDVSTLGKIDIQGPDAAEFLNRVYVNGWKSLGVGRARYGIMLREDGVVFDDGTTTRIAPQHYLMTTTTANAARVMAHLEFYLQTQWPELDVHVTSVTDQWAAMALAGPESRAVLAKVGGDRDVSNEALPFMGFREGIVAGAPARVFRISFSGELGYEINVPADYGLAVWEAVMEAGREHGITPYGLEAMDIMRVEKGHLVVGADIDGRVTPYDLGLERMLSTRKDFIGKRSLGRPAYHEPQRERLVGLRSRDGKTLIPPGAQIVADAAGAPPKPSLGRVTSYAWSPALDSPIALALVAGGAERKGETLWAVSPLTAEQAEVTVTSTVFFDPDGERLRG
ncbi:MAG: sarcosine oxidase subunit alpha family protein [Gammaproteobacteria bacterium]|nr:sarcosine oxidase subunit alpha family protein [Gammaproteobacteria bacterium]NIR85072.1 sarcosine oxidase subunit alpha family protein [Gammaproteobacteria bacterium]NIR91882.1 sarcosine oxidase subunit alpha family protein [Gammaproteobacteria bacterium]NIU06119.1 sarcosine oxidase subunit alpha family protein [Gammaproteobacteria bacterium]NIV76934.1 sarcosine oxidase subunit alpha family protein [Gammaproteobacteria bacterium]